MKRMLTLLLALLLTIPAAQATILPATGVDEGFRDFTGIECTPAVILCERLAVLDERGDQGGNAVETIRCGATVPVIESWDGWAQIYYADGTKTGWVNNQYLLFDPAWYVCDKDVQVYAYDDFMAPRVASLPAGTVLPILRNLDGWVQVSLEGGTGYIRKAPADTVDETWFRP